jgi:16S rRNA (guanine966-N2)-methyltransferase
MPAVRIIGGEWRSRRITFSDMPGLRPTQDRIRETLFNWLMPFITGAQCLDLFAGSGVLGFEALSRGAAFSCFVDSHAQVLADLRDNAQKLALASDRFALVRALAPKKGLNLPHSPYDIVFLDPPFRENLLVATNTWLADSQLLANGALIYMEMEKELNLALPAGWEIFRRQDTPTLAYQLVKTL